MTKQVKDRRVVCPVQRWATLLLSVGVVIGGATIATLGTTSDEVPELREAGRFPPPFCCYMTLEFGPTWCHTMQEEIILRIFDGWCERTGWKKSDG